MGSLQAIWKELTSPPIYPFYMAIGVGLVTVLAMAINDVMKKRRAKAEPPAKSPDILFLEGALDEDPERKPNPNYTYEQFKADLYDRGLTFQEIYEKCGGVFPKKPEEKPPGAGYTGPVDCGPDGFQGYQGPLGVDSRHRWGMDVDARMKELLAWHAERVKENGALKIVKPPPAYTVITIKGQQVPCRQCRPDIQGYPTISVGGGYPSYGRQIDRKSCKSCNGTGFVIITHG